MSNNSIGYLQLLLFAFLNNVGDLMRRAVIERAGGEGKMYAVAVRISLRYTV